MYRSYITIILLILICLNLVIMLATARQFELKAGGDKRDGRRMGYIGYVNKYLTRNYKIWLYSSTIFGLVALAYVRWLASR